MNKFLATTAAGLAIATGSVAVATLTPLGTAFAQDGTGQTPTTQSGADHAGHKGIVRAVARAAVKDAAGVIGISPQDLMTELKDGKSVAEVATAHGVDPQTVIDKLTTDANARIDQAVANGKVTQEKADAAKAKTSERVTKLVNKKFDGSRMGARKQG
jgi:uncharacterized protein YidB (DUF937 family)